MAVHWFAWLCFGLAILSLLIGLWPPEGELRALAFIAALLLGFAGYVSSAHADSQNGGLGSRNKKEFTSRGYKVINAYGHTVCVAAGVYKLCLQEHKDATGKKQLVMPLAKGGSVVVGADNGESGFFDAIAHAPHP